MEKHNNPLPAPTPLIAPNQPVDWLFVFKFNTGSFPGCDDDGTVPKEGSPGIFGGQVQHYRSGHSQQYVYASSKNPKLVKGEGCVGATHNDPLGATFGQVYNQPGYYYVLWNDQFYNNPIPTKGKPWGHSKGMLAWNEDGEGMVLQVSTPSWPASGSKAHPRQNDGNTLGCVHDDDIEVSQHFFALKLNQKDVIAVLNALYNSSVVTDTSHPEIVQNGGPAKIQALVNKLGVKSRSRSCTTVTLSSGIQLISKPRSIAAPPWQLVSAQLDSIPLRVASWWAEPLIYTTDENSEITCWPAKMNKPGPVEIAISGAWNGVSIGLKGGEGKNYNHAKIGISKDPKRPLCFFGDMNQQGALRKGYAYKNQSCSSSQNGRGGMFYVLNNPDLHASMAALIGGDTAPTSGPNGR